MALARFALVAAAGLIAAAAHAADCGDDVHGVRVPCRCGDTVVSDTVLRATDPISFSGRCRGDGLIVRASDFADTVVLDLAGLSIVGSETGTGIDVDRGGSEGALIVGGHGGQLGQIVAFNVGVRARDPAALRRLESIELKGNRREGLQLRTAGAMIVGVHALRNGSDGFRITGRGGRVLHSEAIENGAAGIRAYVYDLIVDARAVGNARHGIVIGGYRNDLRGSVARDNQGYGVLLAGQQHRTNDVVAEGNSTGGVGYRSAGGSP